MSETQARQTQSSRGRSSARGSRGGHGGTARGGPRTSNKPTNTETKATNDNDMLADQGELGEMKKRYSSQLNTLKELFPDWTEVDLVLALEETDGDLQSTIERISEGNVSQFSEIKKKPRDRARSKVKEQPNSASEQVPATRSGRGRGGLDSARESTRGRSDRGRGSRPVRGGSQAPVNGTRKPTNASSVPTMESSAYNSTSQAEDQSGSLGSSAAKGNDESANTQQSAPKKTWASMFATPKPAPAPKPAPKQKPQASEPPAQELERSAGAESKSTNEDVDVAQPQGVDTAGDGLAAVDTPVDEAAVAATITPPKDDLTEDNLEHVPDTSRPKLTETSASTVASSRDIGAATPSGGMSQQSIHRTLPGGFTTSAYRAAAAAQGRSASFQRKILEQQEAVVMPGNHAVDRTAVQFGSMGLNGDPDSVDVDEHREEAETRTQPPQHSPTSQPRAALPPAPRQQLSSDMGMQDGFPTAKQPGLISVAAHQQQPAANAQQAQQSQQSQQHSLAQTSSAMESQYIGQPTAQSSTMYGHFGRYGQPHAQADIAAPTQKPYDPFSQQMSHSGQFDGLQSHGHLSSQAQHNQSQAHYSSAPLDQASYYTSEYQRNPYQNYYGSSYGQQSAAAHQEAGLSQQRSTSGFGAALAEPGYPSSQSQQASSRYGDNQGSGGHNTPQPVVAGQAQGGSQNPQAQHLQQAHHSQTGHGAYPYGHPYYSSPYFNTYMNQYGYSGQNYGGHFGGKTGMYGQPHHSYGLNPQTSYEQHSSSPSNLSGFGHSATHGRESALSSSLGDYGRGAASSQTSHSQQGGNGVGSTMGGFGSMPDYLNNRSQSGTGSSGNNNHQHQHYAAHHQQSGLQGVSSSSAATGADDPLKAFSDAKSAAAAGANGPNPSALAQSGRPGSAAADKQQSQQQTQGQHAQQHQQQHQQHQHYHHGQQQQHQQQHAQQQGGYPSHLNHHLQSAQVSQYGGLGGLSGHQTSGAGQQGHHQGTGVAGGAAGSAGGGGSYSGYGNSFGSSYGSYGGRGGGWSGNYGH